MNKLSQTNAQLKKSIYIRIVVKSILFTVFLFLFISISYVICSNRTWFYEDSLYQLLHTIKTYIIPITFTLLLVSYILIFAYEFNKVFQYLENISDGYNQIDSDDDQLIQLPSELKEYETKINQLKLNLSNNKRAAKEAEQRKNDLVVYLAHDLKTPLTSIIGYLTLLKDEPQISDQMREHYLDVTLDKSLKLEDLINEFFEITRFNLTHQTLEYSRVNLTRLLEQLVYEFKPMLDEKNLTCSCHVEKDFMIKCDVNKMQRVLDNLLRNAVNYSFENSEITIDVHYYAQVHIIFTNHGNTIPKDKLDRIFEQFFRLDSSRTTSTGGAGLGLAIAKEIVELHNGQIKAKSYDEKIIFEIILPCL